MTDEQGRTTVAAEAMEDAAFRWIGRDLGTIHRDDIAAEALAAADRWDREHGYVRIKLEDVIEKIADACGTASSAIRIVRAAGEDQ